MKIAICDDDALCLKQVCAIVEEYKLRKQPELEISVYESASDLLMDVMRVGSFDIYILDVIMPGINGIQLGRQLRKEAADCKIIYLTSSRDYAVDSYSVKASDYILKPAKIDRLFESLDEAILTIASRRDKSLIVRTRESSVKLTMDSILYAALENKSIAYHLTNGNTVDGLSIRTSFSEAVQALLKDGRFALCGSGVVVNLYHINTIGADTLFLKTGETLYVGRRACRELRTVWIDFWMNKEGNQ